MVLACVMVLTMHTSLCSFIFILVITLTRDGMDHSVLSNQDALLQVGTPTLYFLYLRQ